MRAIVQTEYGVFAVDLETEEVAPGRPRRRSRLRAPDGSRCREWSPRPRRGSTIVAVGRPQAAARRLRTDAGSPARDRRGLPPGSCGDAIAEGRPRPDRLRLAQPPARLHQRRRVSGAPCLAETPGHRGSVRSRFSVQG
jgi:hypothetical protein